MTSCCHWPERYLSVTDVFMQPVTKFRNSPGCCNKLVAQLGYTLILGVALIETIITLAITLFSAMLKPCYPKAYDKCSVQLLESVIALGWACVDFGINLCAYKLLDNQKDVEDYIIYDRIPPGF